MSFLQSTAKSSGRRARSIAKSGWLPTVVSQARPQSRTRRADAGSRRTKQGHWSKCHKLAVGSYPHSISVAGEVMEAMWIANQVWRWQCGIISLIFILATAVVCLAVPGSEVPVSLRLVQAINKAERVSLEPFNSQGLLAVRAGDVIQLWDSRTGQLKFSLDGHGILRTNFSSDGATFITSSREK